jgi:hypothetical protein
MYLEMDAFTHIRRNNRFETGLSYTRTLHACPRVFPPCNPECLHLRSGSARSQRALPPASLAQIYVDMSIANSYITCHDRVLVLRHSGRLLF